MNKTPMQTVVERFGTGAAPKVTATHKTREAASEQRDARRAAKDAAKRALANKLAELLDRPADQEKADFADQLFFVSNKKLLNLMATYERVQKDFGSKTNLVEQILARKKRSKDESYRQKLLTYSMGRLLTILPKA